MLQLIVCGREHIGRRQGRHNGFSSS
jgi:hypothetical protein